MNIKKRAKNKTKSSSAAKKSNKYNFKSVSIITLKVLAAVILTIGFLGASVLIGGAAGYVSTTQPVTDEELAMDSLTTTIYDISGNVIAQLKGSDNKNRIIVKYDQVPDNLKYAFVALEDKRFFDHQGIDIIRTGGAILNLFLPGGSQYGGSTITQQLVKNITGDDMTSIPRKIREIWRALQLEQRLNKEQILEAYMNVIYMGYDCYGVQAASKAYFNKDVWDLNLAECAYLAGITNNPYKYNPLTDSGHEAAIKRQKITLDLMEEQKIIDSAQKEEALKYNLVINKNYKSQIQERNKQSYFVDQVIIDVRNYLTDNMGYSKEKAINMIYGGGLKIQTTMDPRMQSIVDAIHNDPANFPGNEDLDDPAWCAQAATVIIDPQNGQVRALYGGYGEKKTNMAFNRATQSARSPGSSIKPIAVYGPLLDAGVLKKNSTVDEKPVKLNPQKPNELWPQNFTKGQYRGNISIRTAIATSSNVVPAILFNDNMDLCLEYLAECGIDRLTERNVALAIGGLTKGVNPLLMAAAYVPYANTGFYYQPSTYTKVIDRSGKTLIDNRPSSTLVCKNAATPEIVTDLLSAVVNDSNGTARNKINIKDNKGGKVQAVGKTGTSSDNLDVWFVGYTPSYVCATWYGYDLNDIIPSNARSQATVIWNKVMSAVHKDLGPVSFDFSKAPDTNPSDKPSVSPTIAPTPTVVPATPTPTQVPATTKPPVTATSEPSSTPEDTGTEPTNEPTTAPPTDTSENGENTE